MHFDGDSDKDEKTDPAPASSKYPNLFMLLNLKPRAYAGPIIVYSKQDMPQLHDK